MKVPNVLRSALLSALAVACGQPPTLCTLPNLSACPTTGGPPSYAGPPTYQTFMTGAASSFVSTLNYAAPLPLPAVRLSAQVIPAAGTFQSSDPQSCPSSGTCVFNNITVIEGYVSSLLSAPPNGAGLKSIDINNWMGPWFESAEYASLCASTGTCYHPTGGLISWYTGSLALLNTVFGPGGFVASNFPGVKLRLHPAWSADVLSVCGITPGAGNYTVAQMENCQGPLEAAMVATWHVDELTINHEPCGSMAQFFHTSPSCSVTAAQFSALETYLAAQTRPNSLYGGIKLGSGYVTVESSYISACYTVLNAVQDYCAEDVYPVSDTSTYYSAILAGVATDAANIEAATCQASVPCEFDVDESSGLRWEPSGGGEANTYAGCGWSGFLSNGTFERWAQNVAGTFGRAIQAATWSIFDSEPLVFITTDSTNSRCAYPIVDNYLSNVMAAAGSVSQHGLAFGRVAQGWQSAIFNGKVTNGKVQ